MKIAPRQTHILPAPSALRAQQEEVQFRRCGVGGVGVTTDGSLAFSLANYGEASQQQPQHTEEFRRPVVATVTKGEGLLVDRITSPPPLPRPAAGTPLRP